MLEIKLKENRNIKCMSLEYYYYYSTLGHLLTPWNFITKHLLGNDTCLDNVDTWISTLVIGASLLVHSMYSVLRVVVA